jgi:hypothetical protein
MPNIPQTLIRTSHAVTIIAGSQIVGQIQNWQPTQSRTITPAFELNMETSGRPTENVPGNLSGLTIQVSRYDLFKKKMEQVWGAKNKITMLSDQLNPFEVKEKWVDPDGTTGYTTYFGCWFSQLGRPVQADGSRIVVVSATLAYVSFKNS